MKRKVEGNIKELASNLIPIKRYFSKKRGRKNGD